MGHRNFKFVNKSCFDKCGATNVKWSTELQIADFCAVARGIRCACVHRMPETEEQICRSDRANMIFLSLTFLFCFVFPTNTSIFCLHYLVIRQQTDYFCPENLPDFEI